MDQPRPWSLCALAVSNTTAHVHDAPHPRFRALSLALLFVVAIALRCYRIDAQSFWYDEGLTVALAVRSLDDIARAAAARSEERR
ncbi:MAG: hypothetical protein C0183_16160, partial [Roseiflexus castenholzii]